MRPGSVAFRSQWGARVRGLVAGACAAAVLAFFAPLALAAPPSAASRTTAGASAPHVASRHAGRKPHAKKHPRAAGAGKKHLARRAPRAPAHAR